MNLRERDAQVIADIGRLRFSPLALVGGLGNRLIDEGGRQLIDLSASWSAASLGYSHPAIAEAVAAAGANMAGAGSVSLPNENAVALAEALLEITPDRGERRVWFGHSGSDAMDCAVRILQAATGRARFISFIGWHHGNLCGSTSASRHPAMNHTLARAGLVQLPYPDAYRGTFSADDVLKLLDHQFATTCPPTQVAAVIIEPLMSGAGLAAPPPGFLAAIQARCRKHGILVVADEVKMGLGRSGLMHCFEHEGLEPDLIVFGKGLGGGLPLSAVVGPRDIMDHARGFVLQATAGNPIATAAGRAVLQAIADEGLIERANAMGALLLNGLRGLAVRQPMIGEVRGRGLAIGIDLVADRNTREALSESTTAKVILRAYQLGAVLFYAGMRGNVLELTPPLTLIRAEAEEGVEIIGRALMDVKLGMVTDEEVAPFMTGENR